MKSLTCVALLLFASACQAMPTTITDTTGSSASNNGSIGTGEYVGSSAGINGGFGNVIGSSSSLLVDSSAAGALNFGLQTGGGGINDIVVIFIDSISGGFSDTGSFTDAGDGGRRAISGFDGGSNRSTLTFASGFQADYAITIESGFSGLYGLVNGGSHNFVAGNGITGSGNTRELGLTLSQIGVVPGGSFRYVATYISNSGYRSNEFHGVAQSTYGGGNPGWSPVTLAAGDFNTFVSVPEVSSALALAAFSSLSGVVALWRRNRRSA